MEISLTTEQIILLLGSIFVPIIALIVNSLFQNRKLKGVDSDTIQKMSTSLNNLANQVKEQVTMIESQEKKINVQRTMITELLQKIEFLQNLDVIRLERIKALEDLVKEMADGIDVLSRQLISAKIVPVWKRKTGELNFTKKFDDDIFPTG